MAKRNAQRRGKSSSNKSLSSSSVTQGLVKRFDGASDSVSRAVGRVPSSTYYWGLGALALGAAAYAAYKYRARIVEVYEQAMEMIEAYTDTDESTEASSSTFNANRKASKSSTVPLTESH